MFRSQILSTQQGCSIALCSSISVIQIEKAAASKRTAAALAMVFWPLGAWNPLIWLDLSRMPDAESCFTTRVPDGCSQSGFRLFWVQFASHSRHRQKPVTVSINKPLGTTSSSRRACGVRFVVEMDLLWPLFYIRVFWRKSMLSRDTVL